MTTKKKTRAKKRGSTKKKTTKRKRKVSGRKRAAASKRNGKKGGRPRRVLEMREQKFLEAMCSAGALKEDICEALGMDRNTIDAICKREFGLGFSAYRKQKKGKGRAMLCAKQLEVALRGNVAMMIWLGKQWLEQKEPVQRKAVGGDPDAPPVGVKHGLSQKTVGLIKSRILDLDNG